MYGFMENMHRFNRKTLYFSGLFHDRFYVKSLHFSVLTSNLRTFFLEIGKSRAFTKTYNFSPFSFYCDFTENEHETLRMTGKK
jgi:hypothetical protein